MVYVRRKVEMYHQHPSSQGRQHAKTMKLMQVILPIQVNLLHIFSRLHLVLTQIQTFRSHSAPQLVRSLSVYLFRGELSSLARKLPIMRIRHMPTCGFGLCIISSGNYLHLLQRLLVLLAMMDGL